MSKSRDKAVKLFVLKRAVRFGNVTRTDVIEAFDDDFRATTASNLMSEAARQWPDTLERRTHEICLRSGANIPAEAAEDDLMKSLDYGQTEFRTLGLRVPDELDVIFVKWTRSLPQSAGVFSLIVASLVKYQPIELRYVGLRLGEAARWRRILPVTLEKMGDQWRLVGQDLDDENHDYPIRVFVLARILDARVTEPKLPKDIIRQNYSDAVERLRVKLNPAFTEDQQAAIQHELMVYENQITVAKRSVFELLRRFSEVPVSEHAVWPLFYRETEDDQNTMHVVLISACQKRAAKRSRALLDSYAIRSGESTWVSPITVEGLRELRAALKRTASRHTAVACYRNEGVRRMSLLWIVGSKLHFGPNGHYPAHSTKLKERPVLMPWIRHAALLADAAGQGHDVGKATVAFQAKLRDASVIQKDAIRHEWVSLKVIQGLRDGESWDTAWSTLR